MVNFLSCPQKHMLWVLSRSTLMFNEVLLMSIHNMCFCFWKKEKPLSWSPGSSPAIDSFHAALHCTKPFVIIPLMTNYDLDNVERNVIQQIIISISS